MNLSNKQGTVFVVSGPSGTGKGTIMEEYFKRYPHDNTFLSISATTRSPRPSDIEGVTYYFKTKEEFEDLIANDGLAEWAEFCGNYYGTPKKPVNDMVAEGKNVVLEIEVQGGCSVMEKFDNAVGIFVLPPSFTELKNRLVSRNTETIDVIESRLSRAREEIQEIDKYEYILINDDLDKAVETFRSILIGESQRVIRNKNIIKEVCEIC
ncbi:MAG: guanylate kinase [Clostridia bacterium]|nr:guanylate kinase [Clostridia bacterium]